MKRVLLQFLPRFIRQQGTVFSRLVSQQGTISSTSPTNLATLIRFPQLLKSYFKAEGHGARRVVGHWLVATSGLVFGIVILGGLTRLTESGLSMVDWHLIHFRPPSTLQEWEGYFAKYQQFPEYQTQRRDMTLDEFKRIYWYEHAHRVYGRLLGLFVALPATFFIARKWASPGIRKVLGLLGWYMVKSGLRQEIIENGEVARVSQYRLAAHLSSALILYLVTLSAGMRILTGGNIKEGKNLALISLRRWSHHLAGLTLATAITGAFVAGLDAGMVYNTFPLMGDRIVPSDIWDRRLGWRNMAENPTTVQFIHRCMALTTLTGVTALWIAAKKTTNIPSSIKRAVHMVTLAAYGQATLGILTLIWNVPVMMASAHQAGSLVFLSSYIWLLNKLRL